MAHPQLGLWMWKWWGKCEYTSRVIKELLRHGGILGAYLLVVTILRWQWTWGLLGLWAGGLMGFALTYLDRLIYVYWLHPEDDLSQLIRDHLRQKRWKLALKEMYQRRNEQVKLTTRSAVFVMAWMPLALFAVTSTGSLFAEGLVMGLGLHILYDLWRDQQLDPRALNKKLFWQVKREVSMEEQKKFLYVFSGVLGLLTLVLI